MAHVKQKGASSKNGRDSVAKRLGVKLFDGQFVKTGDVIIRQRGSKFRAGTSVRVGGDDTLYAETNGTIKFSNKKIKKFNGQLQPATFVNVIPQA